MVNKLEAVIFDFDGTLVDTETLYYETMAQLTWEVLGEKFDKMDYINNISGTNAETSKKYYEERYNMENYDEFENTISQRISENYYDAKPLPNVVETIKFLYEHGIKMAIASNGEKRHIEEGLRKKGLDKYIEKIATKEDVASPKPAPDVYLKAAGLLGVDIKNTIAVEDSKPGALGASNSGAFLIVQTNDITKYMDFSEVNYDLKDVNLLETIKNIYNNGINKN